jgi:tRNA(fMet)-specific endonuclease VapC
VKRVLFDTSAYSLLRRDSEGALRALRQARLVVLTPIVVGELRAGFMRGTRRAENEQHLRQFIASSRVGVVALTLETSDCYALIEHDLRSRGTPLAANDLWIAASAMEHGLTLVTADSHFERVSQIALELLPAT